MADCIGDRRWSYLRIQRCSDASEADQVAAVEGILDLGGEVSQLRTHP